MENHGTSVGDTCRYVRVWNHPWKPKLIHGNDSYLYTTSTTNGRGSTRDNTTPLSSNHHHITTWSPNNWYNRTTQYIKDFTIRYTSQNGDSPETNKAVAGLLGRDSLKDCVCCYCLHTAYTSGPAGITQHGNVFDRSQWATWDCKNLDEKMVWMQRVPLATLGWVLLVP